MSKCRELFERQFSTPPAKASNGAYYVFAVQAAWVMFKEAWNAATTNAADTCAAVKTNAHTYDAHHACTLCENGIRDEREQ